MKLNASADMILESAKIFLAGFVIVFTATACSNPGLQPQREIASGKPYGTALVISGENLNTPYFVGMLDGVAAFGKKVDLVVASCGASIAAGFYQAVPDREKRLEFLTSREYFDLIRNVQMDDPSLPEFAKRLLKVKKAGEKQRQISKTGKRWMPDVFSYSLIRLRDEMTSSAGLNLNRRFAERGPRVVIVASRVDYAPWESGKFTDASRKLFTETLFTDPETGRYLTRFPSRVGAGVPSSSLAEYTDLITDATLGEAVRASISDPLLVNPAAFRGNYYLTGAVNIDPVNIARHLAGVVIARYPTAYDSIIEVPALMATFGYDGNMIRSEVLHSRVDYWIDGTQGFPNFSLGPKPNFLGALKAANPARLFKFGAKLPERYEEFRDLVLRQYRFGFDRAHEALLSGKFSTAHIEHLME